MNAPFASYHYQIEVISPVHIGAAKENDFAAGQDYYYENGYYKFIKKRLLYKQLTNQQISSYANALANNNTELAENVLKQAAQKNKELIYHESYCPYAKQPAIKKHIASGLGELIIPGSSLKGALRSIFGTYLMKKTRQSQFNEKTLFGSIDNNLMRFLQVGDMAFEEKGEITAFKIFSGDIDGQYQPNFEGIGKWKHDRIGNHSETFKTSGFVTLAETIAEGCTSTVRFNWAKQLLNLIPNDRMHTNAYFFQELMYNNWLAIAQAHTHTYLEQEKAFFTHFPNDDFYDAITLIDDLIVQNNQPNTALIRLGAGSGFHAITGNWQYNNHIKTEQAQLRGAYINAIKYKTRKIGFYDIDNETYLQFPGYVKISKV